MDIRIDEIIIGDRFRKDMGDVQQLAESIAEVGLLHPIVVTPDMRLIAGARRIKAHQVLGLLTIEATVIDLDDITKGEFAENEIRKDFTWSERVEISKAIEPEQKRVAEENSQFAGRPKMGENFTPISNGTKTLDRVATAVSTSRPTLSKAREIYDYGDQELIDRMDETGKVDGVYRDLKRLEREALPKPPLPVGKYRVIYADPPWQYEDTGVSVSEHYGGAIRHYNTMTIEELEQLPVKELVGDDSVLFLWVTSPKLNQVWGIIKAWGFEYKTSFVWDKVKHNFGYYNSVRHELLLICGRGSSTPDVKKLYDSVQTIERSDKHSQKPEEFRNIIDEIYPSGNRIELFAREAAEGWDSWGDEYAT